MTDASVYWYKRAANSVECRKSIHGSSSCILLARSGLHCNWGTGWSHIGDTQRFSTTVIHHLRSFLFQIRSEGQDNLCYLGIDEMWDKTPLSERGRRNELHTRKSSDCLGCEAEQAGWHVWCHQLGFKHQQCNCADNPRSKQSVVSFAKPSLLVKHWQCLIGQIMPFFWLHCSPN